MSSPQAGILEPLPPLGRYLTFRSRPDADPRACLAALAAQTATSTRVVGIGSSLARSLGKDIDGLDVFPRWTGHGVDVPSTPAALWCWLRGDDRGAVLHDGRALTATLADAFELESTIDAFQYSGGRDLSGYEDGTENPKGDDAVAAAIVSEGELAASSFVAVQQWVHDLERFEALPQHERDNIIGRRQSDNEELDTAPTTAHVKRTEQESFDPPAFVLRRSMPWADADAHGLVFVAFGRSFDAFDKQLRRMVGADDAVVDALFRFTRPVTGAYYWCPPVHDGKLDLRVLGL